MHEQRAEGMLDALQEAYGVQFDESSIYLASASEPVSVEAGTLKAVSYTHLGTGIIVVTHNLGVAAYMSDYVVVMKDGHIEDQGDRDHILHHSENAYTRRLLSAVPSMGGESYV